MSRREGTARRSRPGSVGVIAAAEAAAASLIRVSYAFAEMRRNLTVGSPLRLRAYAPPVLDAISTRRATAILNVGVDDPNHENGVTCESASC